MVAVLLGAATLAGCIGTDTDSDGALTQSECTSPFDIEGIQIVDTTHDPLEGMSRDNAFLLETTSKRTCSLPAVGWHPLRFDGDAPNPHRYIGEIDMRGDLDLGAVAVLGNGEAPVIYVLDISDRANPEVLSAIPQANTYIVDVKISDDGGLLFAASQSLPTSPELAGLPAFDAPAGFTVYDIADPTNPVNVGFEVDPQLGCHMMSHEIINDQDALFCVSQQVRAYLLQRTPAGVKTTGFVDYVPSENGMPAPSSPAVPVGLPVQPPLSLPWSSGPHDMTVQVDPVTGQTLAIVSHWDSGMRVVDVSEPPAFAELGVWNGEGATHYGGNVHTAMMFYVGDDRYIVATPEYTTAGYVPGIWVLDANDLSAPELVAEWYHPGGHETPGLFLTTHQWQVAPTGADVNATDVRIYLTMNHGGLWVLDFGQILEGNDQDAILGFNLARREIDPALAESFANAALNTWDVNVVDGYIYGSDRATGLWVFHYDGDTLGDPRVTGFA